MMNEINNIHTAEGVLLPSGLEHKTILASGDRMACHYYKMPSCPDKDVMEGAHAHLAEAVWFVVEGEYEFNVEGETVIMKKGDAMLRPFNQIVGSKVISPTPGELLVIASPNILPNEVRLRKLTPETEEHRH